MFTLNSHTKTSVFLISFNLSSIVGVIIVKSLSYITLCVNQVSPEKQNQR